MEIATATKLYEQWLGTRIELVADDLAHKHDEMARGAFPFLRATFYRWAQLWPEACAELADAPVVLSVGDLHVENFGTWRDQEGRLAWGVNDFDEAYPLPWPHDLVRLATSAQLACAAQHIALDSDGAASAILAGYRAALDRGGRPFVLAEDNGWLRKIALGKLRAPERFWKKLEACETSRAPDDALGVLRHQLPDPELRLRVVHRLAGLGSLGRRRFVGLGSWAGGRIAREAKELAPSAWAWASGKPDEMTLHGARLVDRAVRVPDPFTRIGDAWVVRRLAPDCAKVEVADLPEEQDAEKLLAAMGFELGNVHVGGGTRDAIAADLAKRPRRWLEKAAERMRALVVSDWKSWAKRK